MVIKCPEVGLSHSDCNSVTQVTLVPPSSGFHSVSCSNSGRMFPARFLLFQFRLIEIFASHYKYITVIIHYFME